MLTIQQMTSLFRADPERDYQLLVGFEYEVPLFRGPDLTPLRYDGPGGLRDVLQVAAELLDGQPLAATTLQNKLDLRDGSQISLEPGGQLEFSSAPVATFGGCLAQLRRFLGLLEQLRDRLGIHAFFGGANPVHTVEQIGLVVPTERYRLMDAYFPRVGSMGRRMMRQSCSLQVTFDYRDVQLGRQLLRSGTIVAPIAAGLFANAPFIDGGRTSYKSYRVPIWANTDPARCGSLPGALRASYAFEDYVRHVVRAPLFFVATDGGMVDAHGMTFEQFNERGFEGREATLDDFKLHNSTIFTDVRLKHTVEVRAVDAQDPALVPGVLAFLCGLLLCEGARARTLQILADSDLEPALLAEQLGREGLEGRVAGKPTRELMTYLLGLAAEGLVSCFPDGREAGAYLDPVVDLAKGGRTPADLVVERSDGQALKWLQAGRTFERGELNEL